MLPPPSTSGSCRSTRTRPAPTRGGRSGQRAAGTPSEATGKCTGELLVAHRGSSTPEVLHQTQLLECEVVAEPRKRAFEIPPRLLQKPGVGCCSACKVPQYLLAQRFTLSTGAMAVRVYRGTCPPARDRRQSGLLGTLP